MTNTGVAWADWADHNNGTTIGAVRDAFKQMTLERAVSG